MCLATIKGQVLAQVSKFESHVAKEIPSEIPLNVGLADLCGEVC